MHIFFLMLYLNDTKNLADISLCDNFSSQTGTGKTLAFLLPAFIHIEGQPV